MAVLNAKLAKGHLDLNAKIREANEWARKYKELEAQLGPNDDALSRSALSYLHQGKLDEARAILTRVILDNEDHVSRAADGHFLRALTLVLEFDYPHALSDFDSAYRYRPTKWQYALAYADALLHERYYERAAEVLSETSRAEKANSEEVPTLAMAATFDLLGALYRDEQQFNESEKNYSAAGEIYRKAAAAGDTEARGRLAMSLSDAAAVYLQSGHHDQAIAMAREATSTLGQLAAGSRDGNRYLLPLVIATDNLAAFYMMADRFPEAAAAFRSSVAALRKLASENHVLFDLNLATSLMNQGSFYIKSGQFDKAKSSLSEALAIKRRYAKLDPAAYTPGLAVNLNELGLAFFDAKEHDQADRAFTEALRIDRSLDKSQPGVYAKNVADVLVNQGLLYTSTGQYGAAETALQEALNKRKQLVVSDPKAYGADVTLALSALGNLYFVCGQPLKAVSAYRQTLASQAEYPALRKDQSASVHFWLGEVYFQTKQTERAAEAFRTSIRMYRELIAENRAIDRRRLADNLYWLGAMTKDDIEADASFEEALTVYRQLAIKDPTYASLVLRASDAIAKLHAKKN